jgi:hypothetical protein
MKSKYVLLFILAFLSVISIQAQGNLLTEQEYEAVLTKALDAAASRDRRVLAEDKFYTAERLTGSRTMVSDFAGPDAKRVEVTEDFEGKRSRSNYITIGEQFFCREGDKAWTQANKDCAKKGGAMAPPAGNYEYFVETDSNIPGRKIYIRRAKYTDAGGSQERDAARLKFIEIKFAVDESGAITEYTELRRGGIEGAEWSSTQVTRYEYEPAGLRITDPTKGY